MGSLVFADELPDGVVVADEAGRIIVFNRVAARLTGLDPTEVTGKFVFDVLPLRDSEGRDWWVYADPYHGLPTRTRHPERSLYLADGTEILVSVGYVRGPRGARPPQGGSGGMGSPRSGGGLGGVVPPGLALRRLVISLRGAQQRERLERSRAELVSTVAHELRSPLTSVKGFTATLLNKWGRFTDDQKRVMLETVNADADRVTRLITELLDVSRIESGRMEVHRQLVDVPDRARKIIAGRVVAGDAEDRFRLEVLDGLPETWLDADKIDQILGNLVENAVRHGAGIVTIVVEPARLEGEDGSGDDPAAVAVSVRDQGEGIAPDVAPRVFRQFWRGKPRGSRRGGHGGGTGLGLYIVKGLVEAHGGTICVRPAPGGGAEFRFTVPAGTAAA
ncbi:MAG TPA: PAS domain-containing sensor histidine kinase [Streptosporangiaceae bacterium]|nr:PAS domain-containing sensor histidine kinase [Streptosporangiaceae bacterium]